MTQVHSSLSRIIKVIVKETIKNYDILYGTQNRSQLNRGSLN